MVAAELMRSHPLLVTPLLLEAEMIVVIASRAVIMQIPNLRAYRKLLCASRGRCRQHRRTCQ
jgi:hypothetical protein